jgi:hypothetical protein
MCLPMLVSGRPKRAAKRAASDDGGSSDIDRNLENRPSLPFLHRSTYSAQHERSVVASVRNCWKERERES